MPAKKNKTVQTSGQKNATDVVPINRFDLLGNVGDDDNSVHAVHKSHNRKTPNNNDANSSGGSDDGFTTVKSKKKSVASRKQVSEPVVDEDGFQTVTHKGRQKRDDNSNGALNGRPRNIMNQPARKNVRTEQFVNEQRRIEQIPVVRGESEQENNTINNFEDVDESINVPSVETRTDDTGSQTTEDTGSTDQAAETKTASSGKKYVPPMAVEPGWSTIGNRRRRDRFDRHENRDNGNQENGEDADTSHVDPSNRLKIYDPSVTLPGDDMKLNTVWDVWIHENSNPNWDIESYKSIYEISSVGSLWRFLQVLDNLNKNDRQYYIMRKGITPIWEDNKNKQGAICSIMIDNMNRSSTHSRGDLGVDAFSAICILVLNESFVRNNQVINGLCYSIKSRSVLIKLWIKDYEQNKNFRETLPMPILKGLDLILSLSNNDGRGYARSNGKSKISVQLKPIKPNY